MIFRVDAEEVGQSVLQFLKKKIPETSSAKALKRAIEARLCKVNGKLELFASRRLKKGDTVEFIFRTESSLKTSREKPPAILYEDEDMLAINKPAGLVCSSLAIHRILPKVRPFLVHRLDKDTTGVLLLAKTQEAKIKLEELFATRKVDKTYLALVHGWLHEKKKTVTSILVKAGSYAGQTLYRSVKQGKGLRAISTFILKKMIGKTALVECHPITGRTHQLRVQLASLGSPILGDTQYGTRQEDSTLSRHMLHAWKISFPHLRSDKSVHITAPIPPDFAQYIKK